MIEWYRYILFSATGIICIEFLAIFRLEDEINWFLSSWVTEINKYQYFGCFFYSDDCQLITHRLVSFTENICCLISFCVFSRFPSISQEEIRICDSFKFKINFETASKLNPSKWLRFLWGDADGRSLFNTSTVSMLWNGIQFERKTLQIDSISIRCRIPWIAREDVESHNIQLRFDIKSLVQIYERIEANVNKINYFLITFSPSAVNRI